MYYSFWKNYYSHCEVLGFIFSLVFEWIVTTYLGVCKVFLIDRQVHLDHSLIQWNTLSKKILLPLVGYVPHFWMNCCHNVWMHKVFPIDRHTLIIHSFREILYLKKLLLTLGSYGPHLLGVMSPKIHECVKRSP